MLQLFERCPTAEVHWVVLSSGATAATRRGGGRGVPSGVDADRVVSRSSATATFPCRRGGEGGLRGLKRRSSPTSCSLITADDLHQDHRLVSELTWNTFRDHLILEYEIPKYDGDLAQPNVFVRLGEARASEKIDLILEQLPLAARERWFTRDVPRVDAPARDGVERAAGYAEAFYASKIDHRDLTSPQRFDARSPDGGEIDALERPVRLRDDGGVERPPDADRGDRPAEAAGVRACTQPRSGTRPRCRPRGPGTRGHIRRARRPRARSPQAGRARTNPRAWVIPARRSTTTSKIAPRVQRTTLVSSRGASWRCIPRRVPRRALTDALDCATRGLRRMRHELVDAERACEAAAFVDRRLGIEDEHAVQRELAELHWCSKLRLDRRAPRVTPDPGPGG